MITLRKQHQRYEKYRKSGVEWLGEIPEEWENRKIKYITRLIAGQSPPGESVNSDGLGYSFLQGNAEFGSIYPSAKYHCETPNKIALANDILLSVRAPVGALNIADQTYGIGRGLMAVRTVNWNYCWYLLQAINPIIVAQGAGSTFQAVTANQIGNIQVPVPNPSCQSSIASYLDVKCALIDGIIAKKQRQIELLKEKRAAIINRAVTRGLDEDVEMKESGNFGEVPKVWSEQRLKNVVQLIKTGTTPSTKDISFFDGIKTWFTPSDFEHFLLKDSSRTISESAIQNGECRLFPAGSVLLICIGATLGKVGYSEEEFCCNQQINVIVPSNSMNHRFIAYFLLAIQELIKSFSLVTTMAILNQDRLRQIPIIVPSCAEQDRIADYIDQKTARIDSVIEINEHSISLLSEYKTSLISHAVTGRIKVA
ncbi:MAG TPA: restriction endonuclease subunit S [Candidatus Nanoarchaeia archaeon]|nr:restriction endonuclease subunit S [Candidatus Nanoarchaeia archaeon]